MVGGEETVNGQVAVSFFILETGLGLFAVGLARDHRLVMCCFVGLEF
jgi:hypothetical protein